eukprot:526655_1
MAHISIVYLASALCLAFPAVHGYCGGTQSYIGDGYCDSDNNNAGCNWDGGDCCSSTCVSAYHTCGPNFNCLGIATTSTTTTSDNGCNSVTFDSSFSCQELCESSYGLCRSISSDSYTYNGVQSQSCKCCDCGHTTSTSTNYSGASESDNGVIIVVIVVICIVILAAIIGTSYKKRTNPKPEPQKETPVRRQNPESCLCLRKVFHFGYSFKPMLLLFYALYSDVSGLLDDMVVSGAGDLTESIPLDGACDVGEPQILALCRDSFSAHPLYLSALFIIVCASVYGFIVFVYSLCKSPTYHTLSYYAFLVMTKRQRYFRIFLKTMYGVLVLLLLMYIIGIIVLLFRMGTFSTDFVSSVFSTLFISGIAVSELRTTNEIHFEYEIVDMKEKDSAFVKPIYLLPLPCCCGCSLETAEDMFERLEEAVSVYAVTKQSYLLKEILLDPTEEEIERVMQYYSYIYTKDRSAGIGELNKVQSISSASTPPHQGAVVELETTIVYEKEHAASDVGVDLVVQSQADASISPELPKGWRVVYTADNREYYQNDVTRATSWEMPTTQNDENEAAVTFNYGEDNQPKPKESAFDTVVIEPAPTAPPMEAQSPTVIVHEQPVQSIHPVVQAQPQSQPVQYVAQSQPQPSVFVSQADASPELPKGWRVVYTSDNRKYYQNDITRETSWEMPTKQDDENEGAVTFN